MSNNLILPFLIATIYLVDEKINQLIEVNGFGFILISFLYFTFNYNIKLIISRKLIFFIVLFYLYEAFSIFLSPCDPDLKTLLSLILIVPYLILIKSGFILNVFNSERIRDFIIIITIILLLIHSIGGESYRFIRVQYENSWTALYLSPFIIYNLLINKFHKISIFAIIIIAVTSFSSTFLVILVFFIFFIFLKSKKYLIYLPFIFSIPFVLFYFVQPFYERVETVINYSNSEILNLSSLVWLNGFSMASSYFSLTNGFGINFNSMGCSNDTNFYGNYMNQIYALSDSRLNILDGSFLASKLISELGVFGISLVCYLTYKSLRILFNAALNNLVFTCDDRFRITGAILTITFLFIRGGGYYQLGFILALSMLFSFSSKVRNKCL